MGLLSTSFFFDLAYFVSGKPDFAVASFWMAIAGLCGAGLAAVTGLIDWLAIPRGTRAKGIGLLHGGGNVVVVVLFLISALLRQGGFHAPSPGSAALAGIGVALAVVTGWLGGELVDRLTVGVDEGAHLDSPSSLSGRAASERAREPVLR